MPGPAENSLSKCMSEEEKQPWPAPRVQPPLDSNFRPAALATRAFRDSVRASGETVPVGLALEQADGSIFHHATEIFGAKHPGAAANFTHVERLVKMLLWAWGGWRIHFDGPPGIAVELQKHFRETATGKFDSNMIGD